MIGPQTPVKYVYSQPESREVAQPGSKKRLILFLLILVAASFLSFTLGVNYGKRQAIKSISNQPLGTSPFPKQPFFRITALESDQRADEVTVLGNDKKIIYKDLKTGQTYEIAATNNQLESIQKFVSSNDFLSLLPNYGTGCSSCLAYVFVAGDGDKNIKTIVTEWEIKPEPATLAPFVKGFEDLVSSLKNQ